MIHKYSFLVLFLTLLSVLTWWSGGVESTLPLEVSASAEATSESGSSAESESSATAETSQRRELVEVLDRLASYEHYYRSVYGHFTKLTSRLGYTLPSALSELYEVRVVQATKDRLMITAFSEVDGKTGDLVSIDQDFRVRASFNLPSPRRDYLRLLAFKHLRAVRNAPYGHTVDEKGAFQGFFHYELRHDSQGRKVAFAYGMRSPVVGLKLELRTDASELAEGAENVFDLNSPVVGQTPVRNVMTTMEEAYLAQRIFHGEMGRYAKNWSELSRIAAFRFEGKDRYGSAGQVPFGDGGPVLEIDAGSGISSVDRINQESVREPSSASEPLEIEAL